MKYLDLEKDFSPTDDQFSRKFLIFAAENVKQYDYGSNGSDIYCKTRYVS